MSQATDSLARRFPTNDTPTGRRIAEITERRLLWFERMRWYGPLPTTFLLDYSRLFGFKNEKRAREDLKLLVSETDTPYGGKLLHKPQQQFRSRYHPRNQQLVYDVNGRSVEALKDAGRDIDVKHNDHMYHRMVKAWVIASIELAILELKRRGHDIEYVPQHILLDGRSPRVTVPYRYYSEQQRRWIEREDDLEPDYLYCIYYGTRKRTFALEVGRATETQWSEDFDRKTARKNTLQYAHLIGGKLYRELYGFDNLLLQHVVTNEEHMNNIAGIVHEIATSKKNPEGANNYTLFKHIPNYIEPFMPPRPMYHLVTEPWLRVGYDPFDISQA